MRWALPCCSVCLAAAVLADEVVLQGHVGAHDPSTITRADGLWRVFVTGRGVRALESPDLVNWTTGPPVFARDQTPEWVREVVPGFRGRYWAPDVAFTGDEYRLYYSVSRFGKQTSAIGLATATTLDADLPSFGWRDRGAVIVSQEGDPYNAIDPSVLIDEDGRHWMAFGSYWEGIYLTELDPKSGLRLGDDDPKRLAWAEMIEAATLLKREGRYYLFVNHGLCCRGVESTYRILVGRSDRVGGPFLDRGGSDLIAGGGTVLLATDGRRIGPGHVAPLASESDVRFGFHYYDGEDRGRPKLGLARWSWTPDGWPTAVEVQLSGEDTSPRFRRRPAAAADSSEDPA